MAGSRKLHGPVRLPELEGVAGETQGKLGRGGKLAQLVTLGGGLSRVEAGLVFLAAVPRCRCMRQFPNSDPQLVEVLMRCSHIQSMPSAAS